jgi:OmpA-OmpF porin, OOP family
MAYLRRYAAGRCTGVHLLKGVHMSPFSFLPLLLFLVIFSVNGKTLHVPENHNTIQAAVDNAEDGDTVFIHIGTYKESVTLKDNIFLVGEEMSKTIVSGNRRMPVLRMGNNTYIKTLTLTKGRIGILCENANAAIEQVIVTKNYETGIHCLVSLPNIYNCVIYRNKWSGIYCESTRSIKTSIRHCVIAENGYNGIMLEGNSEVLVVNNVIYQNKQYGIWGAQEARRSRIIYNNFFGNRSPVNLYLKKDMSNSSDDPGYPLVNGQHDFFSTSSVMLKGRGKDGATIGLIGGDVLTQNLNDPDEDNVMNKDDRCPSIPEDIDNFEDDDGCPEFDNDKDGIFDTQDACPNSAEDYDGFRDEDGCNDQDNDKDGIPDSIDVCKNNKEVFNGYKDDDGCPDEVPAGSRKQPEQPAVTAPAVEKDSTPVTPPKKP